MCYDYYINAIAKYMYFGSMAASGVQVDWGVRGGGPAWEPHLLNLAYFSLCYSL
jgi:hypothetical protein